MGITRNPERADQLRAVGAVAAIGDAVDAPFIARLVAEFGPEVIVNQLTSLPSDLDPKRLPEAYAANDRIRREGTAALLAGAVASGIPRFVSQSAAFWYAPTPGDVKTEEDAFDTDAPEPTASSIRTMLEVERRIRATPNMTATILRYASFYGPGTWYTKDGAIGRRFRRWMYPIVGSGKAVTSFVHIDDAAEATVLAVESGQAGTFNVADDEPAAARDWMPAFAASIRAPRPYRVPEFAARMLAPAAMVRLAVHSRGASNRHIREVLGWQPRHRTWREGFAAALPGDSPAV